MKLRIAKNEGNSLSSSGTVSVSKRHTTLRDKALLSKKDVCYAILLYNFLTHGIMQMDAGSKSGKSVIQKTAIPVTMH